jgi:FtsZ-binding cell division protein ZapB
MSGQTEAMEVAELRVENQRLQAEVEQLQAELEELRQEMAEVRYDSDVDVCHAAGLTAQIKALIAEGDACPNKAAHPLLERVEYTHSRTGEKVMKTRAYPLYREAFDAEALACGIEHPEKIRG